MCGRVKILSLYILFKTCIELTYYYIISPIYKNALLPWTPNWESFGFSIVFVGAIAITLPNNEKKLSFFWCIIFDCISVIPCISLFWMISEPLHGAIYITLFDCIIHLFLKIFDRDFHYGIFVYNKRCTIIILRIIFFFYILSVTYLLTEKGIDFRSLSFLRDKEIYAARLEITFNMISRYLFNWCEKLFFPFFLSIYMFERKYLYMGIIILMQVLIFLSYANKTALFSIILVMGTFILFSNKKEIINTILGSTSIMMILVILSWECLGDDIFRDVKTLYAGILGMRVLFFPAFIKYRYFEFFENHEYVSFSEGLIGKILGFQSPYSQPVSTLMSAWVNGFGGSWNTGAVSDAYANIGEVGVLVAAIIIGVCLKFLDIFTCNLPACIKLAATCVYPFYLNDNGILTTLLTNGFIFMIILLGIYGNIFNQKNDKNCIRNVSLCNSNQI